VLPFAVDTIKDGFHSGSYNDMSFFLHQAFGAASNERLFYASIQEEEENHALPWVIFYLRTSKFSPRILRRFGGVLFNFLFPGAKWAELCGFDISICKLNNSGCGL